ncbi:MAG: hypothetical protein L0Y80_00915 [Ignavibacteriae bacterium]|nr:hypothetical protein [Ignavibacteriota bacterium]
MDDPAAYGGYKTRFFRDVGDNTVQIYADASTGRIVHLWADAANESISFTIRVGGKPVDVLWKSRGVTVSKQGTRRFVSHMVSVPGGKIELGHFLLASMRKERDFQYQQKHLLPFDSDPYIEHELPALIERLERVPPEIRSDHLKLLRAQNTAALRARLTPKITVEQKSAGRFILVQQQTFDGRNTLFLSLSFDRAKASARLVGSQVTIETTGKGALDLSVTIGTDSPSLTPLIRSDILSDEFFSFLKQVETEAKSSGEQQRFRWLERQVKSLELLSSREKLMAGLPNFATYFGRDMMMSALMMEPVWKPEMLQYVLASVLKKLRPNGEVSHEEALGGQAIRENAGEYNSLLDQYISLSQRGENQRADSTVRLARDILRNLQKVRENYMMLDDDFQLPVLAGRYVARNDIPRDRKRNFLLQTIGGRGSPTRLSLLLMNLSRVADLAAPYAERPDALNLIAFPKVNGRWFPGSWRDSNAGYAGGRFAFDINCVWVPKALEATSEIFALLKTMNYSADSLERITPELRGSKLSAWMRNPALLDSAITTWRGATRHFWVSLSADEVRSRVNSRLALFPEEELSFWQRQFEETNLPTNIEFLALSLDSLGNPVHVVNTDPAMLLLVDDFSKTQQITDTRKFLSTFLIPYPAGLFVENLGPLVANDLYASDAVWETFRRDRYHSPYTVWGREVNVLLIGLLKQLQNGQSVQGLLESGEKLERDELLKNTLNTILTAAEASGLQHHELWTYKIEGGRLFPKRYPTGSDTQLWNVTDLSVQFLLDKINR